MRKYSKSEKISKIETTSEIITGRAGLTFFNRYLEETGALDLVGDKFGTLRKNAKGASVRQLISQILLWVIDGTCNSLSFFDQLKQDPEYAATIEQKPENLVSSHAVKRFLGCFSQGAVWAFRDILLTLFLWRLKLENHKVITITIDTMVMDNNEAKKRDGVSPTYKKVEGFQPLQMIWNGHIIDAIFRGGKKNGNHGDTVVNMVSRFVKFVRKNYSEDVPIVLRLDAGFYSQKNFKAFDKMNIAFIASGKLYPAVKDQVNNTPETFWDYYDNGQQRWGFYEFGWRGDSWDNFWPAIYTRAIYDGKQLLLKFARPDNLIITNIGKNESLFQTLSEEEKEHWKNPRTIVKEHHGRGADELPHRGLKNLTGEGLPFKRFQANQALYYLKLIAFFLFESYKKDVTKDVISVKSYASTFRRKLLDFAGKIIKKSRQIILKISNAKIKALDLENLWYLCNHPPPIMPIPA